VQKAENVFRQFVASIVAGDSHDYFFSLSASADQPYRCGVSPEGSGDIVEYRVSISVSMVLLARLDPMHFNLPLG
jgi:hypothetical protein